MTIQQTITLRSKMLGVLLRDARTRAGKSLGESAEYLGISSSTVSSYEQGRKAPSLPELELLSVFYQVPLAFFLHRLGARPGMLDQAKTTMWLSLRQRIIAISLKTAREGLGRSLKELSEATGFPVSRIRAYERGDRPIPLPELETLLTVLEQSIDVLESYDGQIGRALLEQQLRFKLSDAPFDVLQFLAEPDSITYLELAMRLKSMSAETLKGLTEGLKELTE